jgi:PAS domain S-box-containing protein
MLQHIRLSPTPLSHVHEQPRVLSLLLDKTEERIYLINTDFELLYFNRTADSELHAIVGRTVQVGENIFAVLPPSFLDSDGLLYHQLLERQHARIMSGRSIIGDGKYRNQLGEERWIKMRISPVQMPTGEVVAIAVIVTDITRRKQAEIRESEYSQHIRGMLESMVDVAIAVDELQTIVTFNKAAAQIFGYSSAEILGKPLATIFPDYYVELLTDTAPQARSQRNGNIKSVMGRRKNGEIFPIEATISIPSNNGAMLLTIIARDITERTEMENGIREANSLLEQKILHRTETLYQTNKELHRFNEEKNDIINMLSHDLKNPIGTIHGFAEMLLLEYEENEQIHTIAHHIMRTSNQMLELVTNLLNLNAIESGATTFRPTTINIVPILEAFDEIYSLNAARKNITFETRIPKPDISVYADEIALHQIIENLASNAVKFAPAHTNVRMHIFTVNGTNLIDIERNVQSIGIPLRRAFTPNSVILAVQDEGVGITPKDMPFLFTKFCKLSAQPTGGETSSGLGLSIVKRLVEGMNGRVWCDSESGKGATFFVELPTSPKTIPSDYTLKPSTEAAFS